MSAIRIVPWPDHVRRRPEMYLGSLDEPGIGNCFVTEALCDSFDGIVSGSCTEVSITLAEREVTIENNGPGVSMEADPGGTPLAEAMMTTLFACRHMKANKVVGDTICRSGIAVVNALSATCTVDNKIDGRHWQQRYTCGTPDSPFADLGPTEDSGFNLRFTPDAELIPDPSVDPTALVTWLTGLQFAAGRATLWIHDQLSGQTIVTQLQNGSFSTQGAS